MIAINAAGKEQQGRIYDFWVAGEVLIPRFEFDKIQVCDPARIRDRSNSRPRPLHAVLCEHFGVLDEHLRLYFDFLSA